MISDKGSTACTHCPYSCNMLPNGLTACMDVHSFVHACHDNSIGTAGVLRIHCLLVSICYQYIACITVMQRMKWCTIFCISVRSTDKICLCDKQISDPFLRCPSRRELRFLNDIHQTSINPIWYLADTGCEYYIQGQLIQLEKLTR